jgi:hypothetical protein
VQHAGHVLVGSRELLAFHSLLAFCGSQEKELQEVAAKCQQRCKSTLIFEILLIFKITLVSTLQALTGSYLMPKWILLHF